MPTPHLSQTTQPHSTIQKHNAETEILSGYILQLECQRFTQSQDWRNSLCTTHTKNKKLDTRTHHWNDRPKNIQSEDPQWGNLHQK